MAEAIFKKMVKDRGWQDHFVIDSAGTSHHHQGEPYHPETISVCERNGVPISGTSRPVKSYDFLEFDFILALDESIFADLHALCDYDASLSKIHHMLTFMQTEYIPGLNVPDPYYSGREGFAEVFRLLYDSCGGLLAEIERSYGQKLSGSRANK